MAPAIAERSSSKSSRCLNPSRKVRVIGKIGGFTNQKSDSKSWITVMKPQENSSSEKCIVTFETPPGSRKDVYELDYCYEHDEEISIIYSREIKPLIIEVFNGRNSSVIALGARGSGKTYTIQGSQENPGLAVLAMSEILSKASELGKSVSVSIYEMTQDHAYDILDPKHPEVQVLEDARGKINFKGLSRVLVKSISEFYTIYFNLGSSQKGQKSQMEQQRNHRGLMVHITSEHDKLETKLPNKINFVDLAGYEDPRKSRRDGITFAESKRTNKSLYAILNVVSALNANENRLPYRESKLTRILQESLGSTSQIVLFTCLNASFCQDSISSMSLVYRSCWNTKHILADSTNKSRSSNKPKVFSALDTGKIMSSSLSVRKQSTHSHLISGKKASGNLKGRKLFDEEKGVRINQSRCQSEDTAAQKRKVLPDIALTVTPFSIEEDKSISEVGPSIQPLEDASAQKCPVLPDLTLIVPPSLMEKAPQDSSILELGSTIQPKEVVNSEGTGSQCMYFFQHPMVPSAPDGALVLAEKDDSFHNGVNDREAIPSCRTDVKALAHSAAEEANSSLKKDILPLSEKIRELSNTLKAVYSSTPSRTTMPQDDAVCSVAFHNEVLEPKTPLMELGNTIHNTPQCGTFSNRSTGVKHSLIREYLKFLNSASKEELKSLKGIGEKRATYILEQRDASPEPFKSLDDLQNIGLSGKQIKGMMKQVAVQLFS